MTATTPGLVCAHHHLYSELARGMPAPPKVASNFQEVLEQVWWRLDAALDLEWAPVPGKQAADLLVIATQDDGAPGFERVTFHLWYDVKSDDAREGRGRARAALEEIEDRMKPMVYLITSISNLGLYVTLSYLFFK